MSEITQLQQGPKLNAGLTLIELLVTLVILSILATAALPYVEITVTRGKEFELHRNLREIRNAIDSFHKDWVDGKIAKTNDDASEDGYPKTLQVLVDGVEKNDAKGGRLRYLRRIPVDPFNTDDIDAARQWRLRGYQDDVAPLMWNGKDVYDVSSLSDKTALDGSNYRDW